MPENNITRTPVLTGTVLLRQQGDPSPQILRYEGTIFTQEQYDMMEAYFEASRTRTIFFKDFAGAESEVIITAFDVTRHAANRTSHSTLKHYWTYTLEMEVIAVVV